MTAPRATARLQLHRDFTLSDARDQVPYFARLGVSHLYVSPLTQARPGSTHGYDVIDPAIVSTELGGESALISLAERLRSFDMGLIVDIVPNHMATDAGNAWWWDVLQQGRRSAYAAWFDIDWDPADAELSGKVLAPFLGKPYGQCLAEGQIKLVFHQPSGAFRIEAGGAPYPLAADSLQMDPSDIQHVLARHDPHEAAGREHLHHLLERQHYRLAWWRCAADQINWRRFFEISDLIGIRIEDEIVFNAVHALPLRLYEQGLIDGLRIDHIDGLARPGDYCHRVGKALEERTARRPSSCAKFGPWLIAEKILAHDETLNEHWNIDGTTGYDFMDEVGAVLHDGKGQAALTLLWNQISADARSPQAILQEVRSLILQRHFAAEFKSAVRALRQVGQANPATRDWSAVAIARVLHELLIVFRIYRTYAGDAGWNASDARYFERVINDVRGRLSTDHDGDDRELLGIMDQWLRGKPGDAMQPLHKEAIRRFQQLTPPLAAKSLEDTVFYRYGRLLSRNEVGSDLEVFALSTDEFHRRCVWRASHAPRSMLATATHDHKRGEDVRARLAVLSEMPDLWSAAVNRWMASWIPKTSDAPQGPFVSNGPPSCPLPDIRAPRPAERYMLYQTIVGTWPLDLTPDDKAGVLAYTERLLQWQTKALREAKENSSWFAPNIGYENSCADFLRWLMQPGASDSPVYELAGFAQKIAAAGAVNSLAQTVLRMTIPGVPDLYQGTEFWDFSMVDPDNRRAVDFAARAGALGNQREELMSGWRKGHIKQAIVHYCLQLRRELPDVFAWGTYASLPVRGAKKSHLIAFSRCHEGRCIFVFVPHLCSAGSCSTGVTAAAEPTEQAEPVIAPAFWGDTRVVLPGRYAGVMLRDTLSGRAHRLGPDAAVSAAIAFRDFPVAILIPEQPAISASAVNAPG